MTSTKTAVLWLGDHLKKSMFGGYEVEAPDKYDGTNEFFYP